MTTFLDLRNLMFHAIRGTFTDQQQLPVPQRRYDVGETTLVGRMAIHGDRYLQMHRERFDPTMTIDVEYSLAGDYRNKRFPHWVDEDRRRLDLNIHSRGDPTGNLLCVEVKRAEGVRPPGDDYDAIDAVHVTVMTGPDVPAWDPPFYGYRVGAVVTLQGREKEASVWWLHCAAESAHHPAHRVGMVEHWRTTPLDDDVRDRWGPDDWDAGEPGPIPNGLHIANEWFADLNGVEP
ncbi:MAG: hypothetical protein JWM34_3315 [Ilumatobacteraceae bacterium]|nr:hypothetical protein [Ilumatobacteraceae bacterium]